MMSTNAKPSIELREIVRDKYADRALNVLQPQLGACGPGCCSSTSLDPVTSNLYSDAEAAEIPADAVAASLGCGNPTALAQLNPGETVLDLGSGGGIDVLLSARRVGPTGFAYGLDMTDEMLALANKNKAAAGATNVEFLKGTIEDIPLPENTVDVVISNCVINLAADKGQVLREAFRVLKPGGRFAVSDVVAQGELPADLRADMQAWVGCVAGALEEQDYRRLLSDAGFGEIDLEITRVYDPRDLADSLRGDESSCCGSPTGGGNWDDSAYARYAESGGQLISAFIRATKP
ncbi:MAG TPA: arsenite methyltransferase [Thermomicrobiales bacterium]|nr:arsenite methyltransferase [Thermomicrobiales bacterium]